MYIFDRPLLLVSYKLVDGWVWLTGKSNFALARLLSWAWFVIFLSTIFMSVEEYNNIFLVFLGLLIVLSFIIDRRELIKFERKASEARKQGGILEAIPVWWLKFYEDNKFSRFFFTCFSIGMIPGLIVEYSGMDLYLMIGMMSRVFYICVVLCIDFGGKSAYQKAKEKVKETLPRLVPAPLPTPSGA